MSVALENIARDTYLDMAGKIASTPEIPDEIILVPETCVDYIKLANTYLQTNDEDGNEIEYYSMNDTDSFEDCDISKGEYYDIMSEMVEKLDIDWYQLEEK